MPARHLHLVPPAARTAAHLPGDAGDLGDLGLTAFIFLVGALPVACALAGLGRWSQGTLGLGTAGALLSGRELLTWLLGDRGRAGGHLPAAAEGPGPAPRPPRA